MIHTRRPRILVSTASVIALMATMACKKEDKVAPAKTEDAVAKTEVPTPDAPPVDAEKPGTAEQQPGDMIVVQGFATPESVTYDDKADVYLVSNVDGQPLEADGNGFISKVSPDGKIETLKWIEGGKNKVTLNAPKGMALVGDMLWVTDIDTIRKFDRNSGEPKAEHKLDGATMLNDLTALADGTVFVSDTGADDKNLGAIYRITADDKVEKFAEGGDLKHPNGLFAAGDDVWAVTAGSDVLVAIDKSGKQHDAVHLPKGGLDGLVALDDGTVIVSSWEGQAVYRGKTTGPFEAIVTDVASPADIGFDAKRGRLLIPRFEQNTLEIRTLQQPTPGA